jgi:hypothetical protein
MTGKVSLYGFREYKAMKRGYIHITAPQPKNSLRLIENKYKNNSLESYLKLEKNIFF